jgi:hypothetical protein
MATSATIKDPRHYTSRDGRILPVGGTHEDERSCTTCNFTPTRPTRFVVGQKVTFARGNRKPGIGLVAKLGRRFVTVVWTSSTGRRHMTRRLPSQVTEFGQAFR